ncbi:MAG: hypothetical protein COB67_07045 [SAR324 cluster bacterium]|uniref:Cytochrome c domain-containing protein n=1 Tax=SAR324 cluster bacterium TaxID=2024889 RepID=A0A2A4T3Q5_9DELT|nr:MAG: hypothetical protein COB67_07045 [SAR324 cluster bacterium]
MLKVNLWIAVILLFSLTLSFSSLMADEAVPQEYQEMTNPLTLEKHEVSYWRTQFLGKCALCHGKNGDGQGGSALELADEGYPQPSNFTDKAFMNSKSDGELFYQIEMGGEEKSAMPDFGEDSAQGWGEEKIWRMVAFIRLFAK